MKLGFVTPVPNLDLTLLGDYFFALAHIENPTYWNFFRNHREKDLVLDNGVYERGTPIGTKHLLRRTKWMMPTYVIAPDYIGQSERTFAASISFAKRLVTMQLHKQVGVIMVAHGSTLTERLNSIRRLCELPNHYCKIVALPSEPIEGSGEDIGFNIMNTRLTLCEMIEKEGLHKKKMFYLTGIGNAIEVVFHRTREWIYGMDTSSMCKCGVQGITFDCLYGSRKLSGRMDLHKRLTVPQLGYTLVNIELTKAWCSGTDSEWIGKVLE